MKSCSSDWTWDALALLVHPLKVEIIEAMLWVGRPMSAAELARIFDGSSSLGVISHHVKRLADPGILELAGTRQVRGAVETFYELTEVEKR